MRYADPASTTYDPRVQYVRQRNSGKSRAVNQGMAALTGEYLTVVDADDQLTPDSLSIRLQAFCQAEPSSVDVVIGAFTVFDDRRVYGTRRAPRDSDPARLRARFYMSWKIPFHLNACLMRRSLVDRVGGYDPGVRRCVDGDYALRMLAEATGVAVVPDVVYRYRKHRDSASERIRYRLRTAWDRPKVVWKNYRGWRRGLGVPAGLVLDGCKLLYRVGGQLSELGVRTEHSV